MREFAVITALVWERHKSHLEALESVLLLGTETSDELNGLRIHRAVEAVVLVLYTRMINGTWAAQVLLERGFGIQAGALTRSVLEDYINLMYITNNNAKPPDVLARRYINFQRVVPYRSAKIIDKIGETVTPEQRRQTNEAVNAFRLDFPDGDLNDWSGRDTRTKALEGGTIERYELLFSEFSNPTHGSPEAWQQSLRETSHGAEYLIGPHDVYIRKPIRALCEILCLAIEVTANLFGLRDRATKPPA